MDPAIFLEARKGDQGAFSALYAHYQPSLLGYLRGLAPASSIEDTAQEVWLRVTKSLGSLRLSDKQDEWAKQFGGWLFTIARNLTITEATRHRPPDILVEDGSADPTAAEVFRRLDAERVARAMEQLTPRHRKYLSLYYGGGLSCLEIAATCNDTPGAVKHTLARARARLAQLMEEPHEARHSEEGTT